jgi:hypothetical protein
MRVRRKRMRRRVTARVTMRRHQQQYHSASTAWQ